MERSEDPQSDPGCSRGAPRSPRALRISASCFALCPEASTMQRRGLSSTRAVSYTHLRAHETSAHL
eukprot:9381726-Alexandrium_andersonii.AAC.1